MVYGILLDFSCLDLTCWREILKTQAQSVHGLGLIWLPLVLGNAWIIPANVWSIPLVLCVHV